MSAPYSDRAIHPFNTGFEVVLHLATAVAVGWYASAHGVQVSDVAAAVVLWWLTGLGITAGYHRLWSHRAWRASRPVELALLFLGTAAAQNSLARWAVDHRRHHREVDTERDPYNARWGFWWSHMGWIFREDPFQEGPEAASDLWKDPVVRWQDRNYLLAAVVSNAVLIALTGLITGDLLGAAIIGGLARVVVVQHFTFTINSLSHMWGSQPFSAANTSRDNHLFGVLTLGEGYHNFHHAFEADYRNGIAWHAFDPTKWFIWTLDKLGLAFDLRRTPDDVILRRRFEEGRSTLAERLEAWLEAAKLRWLAEAAVKREALARSTYGMLEQLQGDQLALAEQADAFRAHVRARTEELHGQLQRQADELREGLRGRVAAAEAAVEEALAELKLRRQELAKALRDRARATSEEARAALDEQLGQLRLAFREARAAARAAMSTWEQALSELERGDLAEGA